MYDVASFYIYVFTEIAVIAKLSGCFVRVLNLANLNNFPSNLLHKKVPPGIHNVSDTAECTATSYVRSGHSWLNLINFSE